MNSIINWFISYFDEDRKSDKKKCIQDVAELLEKERAEWKEEADKKIAEIKDKFLAFRKPGESFFYGGVVMFVAEYKCYFYFGNVYGELFAVYRNSDGDIKEIKLDHTLLPSLIEQNKPFPPAGVC